MPSVAVWLLARPQNAILALVVTMLMPLLGLATLSGAILMLLVLQQDVQKALRAAVLAGLVLLAVAFVLGSSPMRVLTGLGSSWLPILGLAAVMRSTRSLTLTLQLAVIVVLIGACAFFALANDPVGFWREVIAAEPLLQSLQLQEWLNAGGASEEQIAGVMTTMFAIGFWLGLAVVILLGYWLYQQQPGKSPDFGRFSDLNFGRVIASLLAITSVAGFAIDAIWIQSIAFILFAVFWLQGAAMVHWLHTCGFVPRIALSAMYVATVLLPQFVIPALAVLGYTDAWFQYRNRVTRQQ